MIRRTFKLAVLLSGLLLISNLASTDSPAQRPTTLNFWQKTQSMVADTWQSTREFLFNFQEIDEFSRVWKGVIPKLEQTLALEDRHEKLPRDAWFTEDQRSNRETIDELLDEAIDILSVSPARRYRQQLRELEAAIARAQADIAEYRQQRVTAPMSALLEKTMAEFDTAIEERKTQIREYRAELEAIKREFADELQSQGLDIGKEQLEFLLSTVIGDDLIAMGVAFDNVKAITTQLEQLLLNSEEDLISGRRYYGMYTVLLRVLGRMQRHLIDAVYGHYLVEIDTIIDRTRTLMGETRALKKRSPASQQTLMANLEAQELTLRTANLYRNYLVDQAQAVELTWQRLKQDIAIARNTYETVKLSGELVALMKSSQQLLDTLVERQIPVLRTFENLEMKREFEKLTARLQVNEMI